MDVMNILILCVVGFCVVVCLVLDHIEEGRKKCNEKGIEDGDDDHQVEKEIVGCDFVPEKNQIITRNIENPVYVFEEIKEQKEEGDGLLGISGDHKGISGDNRGISEGISENFDDWEGIERTELEKLFGECLVFMSYNHNADKINEDLKLELYGLQKLAFEEGASCYGSKWWQKLGDMSRETAMEKYVDIVSNAIPEWKKSGEDIKDGTSFED